MLAIRNLKILEAFLKYGISRIGFIGRRRLRPRWINQIPEAHSWETPEIRRGDNWVWVEINVIIMHVRVEILYILL